MPPLLTAYGGGFYWTTVTRLAACHLVGDAFAAWRWCSDMGVAIRVARTCYGDYQAYGWWRCIVVAAVGARTTLCNTKLVNGALSGSIVLTWTTTTACLLYPSCVCNRELVAPRRTAERRGGARKRTAKPRTDKDAATAVTWRRNRHLGGTLPVSARALRWQRGVAEERAATSDA